MTIDAVLPRPLSAHPALATPVQQSGPRQLDALTDFATAPENTPNMGIARIAAFARQVGPEQRQRELTLVLDGIVARTNELRGFIRDGIEEKAAQARLLADEVADSDRAIAALPADAPADRRRALEQARRRNGGALDDKREDTSLLCHRLDYTARKARLLAAAITDQIGAEIGAESRQAPQPSQASK